MTSVKFNWMAAASLAAVSFAVPTAHAQDANTPGIVRISDSKHLNFEVSAYAQHPACARLHSA